MSTYMTEEDIIETEKALLSAILHDQEILYRVNIKPEDMYSDYHKHILASCLKLSESGAIPNLVSVCNDLREVVEPGYIADITNFGSASINWIHYAKKLIESIQIRRIERLPSILNKLLTDGNDAKDIISHAGEYLDSVAMGFNEYRITSIKDLLPEWHEEFERKMEAKGESMPGIPTGFESIDDATGGWRKRNLIYVGARPSQGKSAILYNMALAALQANKKVGIISVESSKKEILDRMLSSKARVPLHSIKTARVTESIANRNYEAESALYNSDIYFYDEPNANIMNVIAQARRMVVVHDIDVLYVDYAQLIYPANRSVSRVDQVSDISIKLKNLARDLEIPVICAAQLRRDAENRAPQLSDFADTSQIEKDADIAILIHHKTIDQDGEDDRVDSFLHMDKHRDGATMSIPVIFRKDIVTFFEKNE